MEVDRLQQLGLSKNEAKIYLNLLKLGNARAGEISKQSEINRTTTYDSLRRLMEKGLVTYVIEANKKVFSPVKPEKFLKNIKEQENVAKEVIPELNSLYVSSKEEEADIYRGKKGIKSILHDILKHKSYVAFGSKGKFLEIMKHDFEVFQVRKKELEVKSKVILENSARKSEQVKLAYSNFRFISDEYSSPTTTFIYGENIAIIVWTENPLATVIKSKEVTESYKHYFELLWKNAKR